MLELSDETLVSRAKRGDTECMDTLLSKHRRAVLQCARAFFLTGGAAEDLAQEGMIGLYRAVLKFDETRGASFESFARILIKRQIIDAVRKSNGERQYALNNTVPLESEAGLIENSVSDPEQLLISAEGCLEIRKKTEALSRVERTVLKKYLEGKSYAEIAREIKSGVKSVDNAVQRIRAKLR